jgi:hypothetical protein
MVDSVIEVTKARLTAAADLAASRVTADAFYRARHVHLMACAEYAVNQPAFAGSTPPQIPDMYEPVTAEKAINDCCVHLLTTIGLEILYLQRATRLQAAAIPGSDRSTPPAARQAILRVP